MKSFLDGLFKLKEAGTNVKTEIVAGAMTFATMAYIIFVQPVILSACGMDKNAVMAATCIASAAGCFLMAAAAKYPIGIKPWPTTNKIVSNMLFCNRHYVTFYV